ncbi:type IV pilin N-terminal domain-containing protein [Haloplanus ruber]|uniref:Type IV pilin N-terminal domain-containing protein n=1 Tax=Haloplanus ruber TaxID=869892 RepID=A0ABD6D035_9EURY|nr:type IV pilin N-terminal domain-containing protein [Haloplanus ruber]
MPDRAQSELVGTILVVGLVVASVGVAGAYAMETVTQSSEAPQATVTGQVDTDGITLSHQGGDSLPSEDLRLVVRVNESGTGLGWSDGTLSGGDDTFDPGEGWNVSESYAPGSVVTIRLVDEPTNTVLFRAETTVTAQEPVESEMGGKIDAVDSEGEISQGDVSTPATTPTSTPRDDDGDDTCEKDEDDWDDDDWGDDEDDWDDDEDDEDDCDGDDDDDEDDDWDEDDDHDDGKKGNGPGRGNGPK